MTISALIRTLATPRLAGRLLLPALLATTPVTTFGQDFSTVEIRVQEVAEGIHMLTGQGGNIGLSVGSDGAFVVDDQYAPLTEKILAAIATVSDEQVRFVINTHWHGDHTGGNENLAEAGAIVVAHHNVRSRLEAGRPASGQMAAIPAAEGGALPVITYGDGLSFHWNDQTIEVIHVEPSHTDGDSFVVFQPANVIHTGDVFINGAYPFIDRGSGGSIHGFIANARSLLALMDEETRIIPGHGPLARKGDVEAFLAMLEVAVQRIGDMKAQGMTVTDIQEARPMAEFDADWGKGFITPERFIAGVYDSL